MVDRVADVLADHPSRDATAAAMSRRRFSLAALTPLQQAILRALRGSGPGRPMSGEALADAVYRSAPNGGPEDGPNSIARCVHFLRRRLHGTPVAICSRKANGYWLGGPASCLSHWDGEAPPFDTEPRARRVMRVSSLSTSPAAARSSAGAF